MEESMKKQKCVCVVLLVALLVLQLAALVYTGGRKKSLHIDEYYSYILSNSYATDRISHTPEVWNEWITGADFSEFLSVEPGEAFAYGRVYRNNSLDAHPPLFYFLLHTVCSLARGSSSLWLGLGLNIALTLATQILLFFLARRSMKSDFWALLPVAIYGGMGAFFDNTLFIRMYPLLTFFTVLTLLLHHRLLQKPESRANAAWCFLVTFLGIFTQYYFAIPAFFLAAAYCIFLLARKKWKSLAFYAGGMLLSVALVFVLYPAGIAQITGSGTNNVGKEVMSNLFDFSGWAGALRSMTRQILNLAFSGLTPGKWLWLALGGSAIVLSCFLGRKQEAEAAPHGGLLLCLCGIGAASVALISHISGAFVYVRYVYHLFPLFGLCAALLLQWVASKFRLKSWVLVAAALAILCSSTITFAAKDSCAYLFRSKASNYEKLLDAIGDRPVVILNNGTTYQPTGLMGLILQLDRVYMANHSQMDDINAILPSGEETVFILLTDQYWSQGLDGDATMTGILEAADALSEYEKIGTCDFSAVYLAR